MSKLYPILKPIGAICLCACILFSFSSQAQVNVTANQTATALAQKLVGTGVVVLNPTLTCTGIANGIFTVVSSNLGLDSGIVLTDGRAATTGNNYGCNSPASKFASTGNGTPGDAQLTALAGQQTHDACILQFDFAPAGDTIKFGYVFGSEEYTDFTCTEFNDVFGFFISGPGYPVAQNIALVPGTNIPVSVNSVNGATPSNNFNYNMCAAVGPGSPFNQYFVNNINGTTITYDGLTVILQAIASVTPCDTYHLKLGIADAGDDAYDSGVFIKAGSLTSTGVSVTPIGQQGAGAVSGPFCIRGCLPGEFIFSVVNPSSSSQTFHYEIAGSAVNGYDYSTIPDSVVIPAGSTADTLFINGLGVPPTGPKTVELLILSTTPCSVGNVVVDSAELTIYDSIKVQISTTPDTTICIGQSAHIITQNNSFFPLVYNWTPAATLNSDTTANPIATPTDTTTYTVVANYPGCAPSQAQITINVAQPSTVSVNAHYQTICLGSPIQFNATASPSGQTYVFLWSPASGLNNPNIPDPVATPQQLQDVTYTVSVNGNVPFCSSSDTIHLHVLPNDFTLYNKDSAVCFGATIQVNASGDAEFTYVWTPTAGVSNPYIIDPAITPDVSTIYTITASYPGCPDMPHQLTYTVENPIATIITSDTAVCLIDSMQILASVDPNTLTYTYTWTPSIGLGDTAILQPMFLEHTAGNYTYYLTATTPIGCSSTDSVTIIAGAPIKLLVSPVDTLIAYGSSVQLSAVNIDTGISYYFWIPNDGSLDNPNISNPVATPLDSTIYTVIGMNQYGCRDSGTVKVAINFAMNAVVPTAFTPNNDGKDDVFRLLNVQYQKLVDFSVFNRWGNLVFHTTNPEQGWDGTFNGVPQEIGTYNYIIILVMPDGTEKSYPGSVTLIR